MAAASAELSQCIEGGCEGWKGDGCVLSSAIGRKGGGSRLSAAGRTLGLVLTFFFLTGRLTRFFGFRGAAALRFFFAAIYIPCISRSAQLRWRQYATDATCRPNNPPDN